jgi:ATP-dependent Clp protease ATP-binding subunit ClpB
MDDSVLKSLQVTVTNRKPDNVLAQSNDRSLWSFFHSDDETPQKKSTPLHYACLLGDMKIAEVLLRNGADWTISDSNDFLPKDYACLNGDRKMQEFKHLCEVETSIRAQEEELRLAGRFAEELELEREKDKTELERLKTQEKLGKGEELRKKHCGWSPSSSPRQIFTYPTVGIEKIIGENIIGQRGPIRSIASAIHLRENGWVDPDRPLVMLFLGSSGVGKTELAKRIAHYLHSGTSKDKSDQSLTEIEKSGAFVRIDMSEYQHDHTVSNLTGMLSLARINRQADPYCNVTQAHPKDMW